MGDQTGIHWTDASWNPITGCAKVSQGCKHCYAETVAQRYWARQYPPREDGSPRQFTDVQLHRDRLDMPLRWKRPRRIFVNSMSDLFHPDVPDDFITSVFVTMAYADRHTFQVLTKRPERMAQLLREDSFQEQITWFENDGGGEGHLPWPLPNVWLGTSIERQQEADQRIPHLLRTPAAVRFLSCEPLLGPIDLTLVPFVYTAPLHWVIVGGESGPHHRPMDVEWARALRDQCQWAGKAFFFKQSSGARPGMGRELDGRLWEEFPTAAALEAVPA